MEYFLLDKDDLLICDKIENEQDTFKIDYKFYNAVIYDLNYIYNLDVNERKLLFELSEKENKTLVKIHGCYVLFHENPNDSYPRNIEKIYFTNFIDLFIKEKNL